MNDPWINRPRQGFRTMYDVPTIICALVKNLVCVILLPNLARLAKIGTTLIPCVQMVYELAVSYHFNQ